MTKLQPARNTTTTRAPAAADECDAGVAVWGDAGVTSEKGRPQPKIRPLVLLVAAANRSWTSVQFTTFQKAFT
jgi:hypothetical protein